MKTHTYKRSLVLTRAVSACDLQTLEYRAFGADRAAWVWGVIPWLGDSSHGLLCPTRPWWKLAGKEAECVGLQIVSVQPLLLGSGPLASSGSAFLHCYCPSLSVDVPRASVTQFIPGMSSRSLCGLFVGDDGCCVSWRRGLSPRMSPRSVALFILAPSLGAQLYAEPWTMARSLSRVQQGPSWPVSVFPQGESQGRIGRAELCSPEDICHGV